MQKIKKKRNFDLVDCSFPEQTNCTTTHVLGMDEPKTMREALDLAIKNGHEWFVKHKTTLHKDFKQNCEVCTDPIQRDPENSSEATRLSVAIQMEQLSVLMRIRLIQSVLIAEFEQQYGLITLSDGMYVMDAIFPDSTGEMKNCREEAEAGILQESAYYWP